MQILYAVQYVCWSVGCYVLIGMHNTIMHTTDAPLRAGQGCANNNKKTFNSYVQFMVCPLNGVSKTVKTIFLVFI